MKTAIYEGIPDPAKEIRQKVFVKEQGCPHIWMRKYL